MSRQFNPFERRARHRRSAIIAAVIVGPALGAGLVLNATNAAFSAKTTNPSNAWTAGTVNITNSAGGTAMFTSTDGVMKPGQTISKCLTVTYSGTLPSKVRLYTTAATPTSLTALDTYLDVSVKTGAAGSTCAVPGTLVSINSTKLNTLRSGSTDYASGLKTNSSSTEWLTATPGSPGATVTETRAFQFDITLNDALATADNTAAQNKASNINFVWEAQNT